MTDEQDPNETNNRRRVLKIALGGGSLAALALPGSWVKPIVQSVIVPAHAAASPGVTTTTTTLAPTTTGTTTLAPTTTIAPTTTSAPTTTIAPTTTPAATTTQGSAFSDSRLKVGIVKVGCLSSGVELYRFKYSWSDIEYVGVMAQQVRPIVPQAVITGEDGYLQVDYAVLGIRMVTFTEWLRDQAVALAA